MSTQYKLMEEVPTAALITRLKELSDAVIKGNRNEFDMRVPAEPDRDADLVLAEAARRLESLSEPAEPVMYQFRTKPSWQEVWFPWQECSWAVFECYANTPVLHDWQYETRALYTRVGAVNQKSAATPPPIEMVMV